MRRTTDPKRACAPRNAARTLASIALAAALAGCGERTGTSGDAAADAAGADAAGADASSRADDAGAVDAAIADASGPIDAGAGAGRPDAGAGAGTDAGRPDAGTDASRPDAGADAGTDAGVAAEPTGLIGTTAAHNTARANVSPPRAGGPITPLTWSATLATAAQTWASGCVYGHSGNGYGENVYASTGSSADGVDAVASWMSEAADYDYATGTCSGECGHYTQVVWNATTSVGCGRAVCATNSPFPPQYGPNWTLIVCDYSPPGNSGGKPY